MEESDLFIDGGRLDWRQVIIDDLKSSSND